MEESAVQISYALDTFYFLVMGALVMFMAPGFAMLEAGMEMSAMWLDKDKKTWE